MTALAVGLGAADIDDGVDEEIITCLDPSAPRSFFLYAGAGSGKTRSLKQALEAFRERHGEGFRRAGRKIAVITFTNAAADEISHRVGDDPMFPISTIHSFCWSLIGGHHADIRTWLLDALPKEFAVLEARQATGKPASQAFRDRVRAMAAIEKRIAFLGQERRFTYNPNGDNFGADSLSHTEVLKITADFITHKPSLQAVLVNRHPFLLIDESQDTTKGLVAALFAMAESHQGRFALGMLGDTMQRIYGEGLADLGEAIPAAWARPAKKMNNRSARRIVALGNAIRATVDDQKQLARDDSLTGLVRFFVAPSDAADKPAIERDIRARMEQVCQDAGWTQVVDGADGVKTLMLEHHMAASRRGFSSMFQALDQDSSLSQGLKRGDLSGLRLFTQRIEPVLAAAQRGDRFEVMALLRSTSPLLRSSALAQCADASDPLETARAAVSALTTLRNADQQVTFGEILSCVAEHGLFEIPSSLTPFLGHDPVSMDDGQDETEVEGADATAGEAPKTASSLEAWRAFLDQPYEQIVPFTEHISDSGPYGTHQGVKGLEFDRVLVVMDDTEARGFMFSYEQLFGTKPLSKESMAKAAAGEETGIDRTARLLYVTCTRAKHSLALVAYSIDPPALAAAAVARGWFSADEVEQITTS